MKTTRFFLTVLIFGTGLLSWNPLGGSQKKLGRVRALGNRVAEWCARRPYTAAYGVLASGVLLCGAGFLYERYVLNEDRFGSASLRMSTGMLMPGGGRDFAEDNFGRYDNDDPDFLRAVEASLHDRGGSSEVSPYQFRDVTAQLSEEGCSCNLCFESKADKEDVAMGAMGCCKTAIICEECFKKWREAGGHVCPWCRIEFQGIHNKLHNGIS